MKICDDIGEMLRGIFAAQIFSGKSDAVHDFQEDTFDQTGTLFLYHLCLNTSRRHFLRHLEKAIKKQQEGGQPMDCVLHVDLN